MLGTVSSCTRRFISGNIQNGVKDVIRNHEVTRDIPPLALRVVASTSSTHNGFSSLASFTQRRYNSNDAKDDRPWFRNAKKPVSVANANEKKKSGVGMYQRKDLHALPTKKNMLALMLNRKPLFPGQQAILQIPNQAVQEAILQKIRASPHQPHQVYLALFHRKTESPSGVPESVIDAEKDFYHTGTLAQITRSSAATSNHMAPGDFSIVVEAHRRLDYRRVINMGPPMEVEVSHWIENDKPMDYENPSVRATVNEVVRLLREIGRVNVNQNFKDGVMHLIQQMKMNNHGNESSFKPDVGKFADLAVGLCSTDHGLIEVLVESNPLTRLEIAAGLLHKELQIAQMQAKIQGRIEDQMGQQQKEFFLKQQLKSIKQELGLEMDDKETLIKKFKERLVDKIIPTEATETINTEFEKLESLEKNSSEFNISRNYLDWLTNLPWSKCTEENFDLKNASAILDRDHYGLQDVKDRILEFIAVSKLNNSSQGKIICLVGPPGVGKTSIGQSISNSLNREFFRFSVGGLYDVAEIKGHRRTYVGAMPGKLIQALKKTQSSNPLIMIDEIDKLGRGHQGDPASALLELLDPAQNSSFVDHYLDVPVDMSQVLFIVTANVTDTIPGPLLDRMEVIRVSGYDLPEKMEIAKKYLLPKTLNNCGLQGFEDKIDPSALENLIRWYCREAGVRNLEKYIEKITRKLAYKVVQLAEEADAKALANAVQEEVKEAVAEEATEAEVVSSGESVETPPVERSSDYVKDVETESTTETPTDDKSNYNPLGELEREFAQDVNNQKKTEEPKLPKQVIEEAPVSEKVELTPEQKQAELVERVRKLLEKINIDDVETITKDNLKKYAGNQIFHSDRMYEGDQVPPGVVMGLAWTAMGGTSLYIETVSTVGKGSVEITGQLGSVMKESAQIAKIVTKKQLELEVQQKGEKMEKDFFEDKHVNLHVPEGAVPKDGPSAGVTMVTAMLSLATNSPVASDLAMTGEVTLTGLVLGVGGVKEKMIAARRAGIKTLIVPEQNKRDVDDVPEYLKEGLSIHFAKEYADVRKVAFPDFGKVTSSTSTQTEAIKN